MKPYLVRHGSTDLLKDKICQLDTTPLSQEGIVQAKQVAARFRDVSLDLVISSTMTRALQTAQYIRPDVVTSDLFKEATKPSDVVGRPKSDPEVQSILKLIGDKYITDPSWHYSDEENFEDLKKRGLEALAYLTSLNKDNVLVVSHGNFMALLVGLMLFGPEFPLEISLKLKRFLRLNPTGVSICTYEDGVWKLQTWNDTTHCP